MAWLDLHGDIEAEFAELQKDEIYEAWQSTLVRRLERVRAGSLRAADTRRLVRATQRRTVVLLCPVCEMEFQVQLPRVDGRIPVVCSLKCGSRFRKLRYDVIHRFKPSFEAWTRAMAQLHIAIANHERASGSKADSDRQLAELQSVKLDAMAHSWKPS